MRAVGQSTSDREGGVEQNLNIWAANTKLTRVLRAIEYMNQPNNGARIKDQDGRHTQSSV